MTRPLFALACAAIAFLLAHDAVARRVMEDNFAGDAVSPTFWEVTLTGPMSIIEADGALHAKTPGQALAKARVAFRGKAHGDFQMDLEYDAGAQPGGADARIQLSAAGPTTYATLYYHRFGVGKKEIIFGGTLDGSASVYSDQADAPDAGKLRLSRAGNVFSAFYWDGQSWQAAGTRTGFADDATPRIQVQSTEPFQAFDFALTDFRLEADGLASSLNFTTQPAGARRFLDEGNYTMKVATTGGLGAVRYEWYFEGNPAPIGTGPTLTVISPSPAKSGKYVCKAIDAVGAVASNPAVVEFISRPAFKSPPEDAKKEPAAPNTDTLHTNEAVSPPAAK